jgi:predicted AlkP superfamily phosphohydrolase/phosphomutase
MTGKTLIIGIDGLGMDLVNRWFNVGAQHAAPLQPVEGSDFPNLSRLILDGARAKLRSVMPLNSAAAWTSFLTGRTPAGHGIFGFTRAHSDGYHRSIAGCDDIGAATLWDIANAHGAPVGMVNCPMTYPPPKLDGFVISGIPIPYNQVWAYPPDAQESLRDLFGPYIVDLPWWDVGDGTPGRREAFIAGMYQMARKREEATLWAMRNRPWRIMTLIFTGTDRLLHSFWHLSDPSHPSHDKAGAEAHGREIRRYFILLDDIIGKVLSEAGKDVPVILMSDHGFGPLHYRFHLRRWLENHKYLKYLPKRDPSHNDQSLDECLRGVDWRNTVAYPASISESGIWINKAGRQARGVVEKDRCDELLERIIVQLVKTAPKGHRPIERVFRREEVLSGPYLDEAPDLLIKTSDTYIVDDAAADSEISPSTRETATHRTFGIFSAHGQGFRRGVDLGELSIVDVLPTVLAAAGIPIPENIEGIPALKAFESPPRLIESKIVIPPRVRRTLSGQNKEEKAMKDQLKGLGYL